MNPHTTAAHRVIATAALINAALLVTALVALQRGSPWVPQFVLEDGLVEWLQFLCFAVLSVFLAFLAVDRWLRQPRLGFEAVVLAGLSVVVGLAALEEVSWFQRVLQLDTPAFFQQHNRQGELNLHNLALGDSSVNKLILVKLIFVIGVAHNLVLPWLARRRPALRRFVESCGLYLPPLWAGVCYLVLVVLSQALTDHPRRGELSEAFGATHYLATVLAAYGLGLGRDRPAVFEDPQAVAKLASVFALFMGFLVFVAWLLGSGYQALAKAG